MARRQGIPEVTASAKRQPGLIAGDADRALSLVLANTRMAERPGVRRPHSLPEIASAILAAKAGYGGLNEVANRVGISTEMLRRFLSVNRLHPAVLPLVRARRIDSLNAVLYMAALPADDQPVVAEELLSGKLSGTDVRALVPLRRRLRRANLRKLMDQVTNSRDRTVYAVVFTLGSDDQLRSVTDALKRVCGDGLVVVRRSDGHQYKAVLSRQGLKNLRSAAQKSRLSLREYMKRLLSAATHDSA
jgi:hypothetical protein